MAYLPWKDSYATGIAKIDKQHRQLIDDLNALYEAMHAGKGREALEKVFRGLVEYTKSHFAAEEGLMKVYQYPDFAAHKAIHDKMAAHVGKLYQDFKDGKISSPIQITNFLKDWLARHIMDTEQQSAPFLKTKGAV